MRYLKQSLTISIGSLAVLLLASCSQDNSLPVGNGAGVAALRITATTLQASQEQPATRVTASPLTAGSIGVFRSQGDGYSEARNNCQYTYTASNGWQPGAADQTVYLMANDAAVCAYYPYNAAYTDNTAIPLASGKYMGTADDLTRHDPADLCYAAPRMMSGANPAIRFKMNHAMAMVQVRLRRSDIGTSPRRLTSVSISNLQLIKTGTVNITAGTYRDDNQSPGGDRSLAWTPGTTAPATGIDLPAAATSEATSALLVPCTLDAAGITFTFTVDRKTMSIEVPVSLLPAFEAGKIHSLVFDLKATSVSLAQVSILDWWREWDEPDEPNLDGTPKDHIELGGVKWALSNLEYNTAYHNYNFAVSATAEGTKLQWNALTPADNGNSAATWDTASDPCARLEPKGTWKSPAKEDFEALAALPNVWTAGYQGVSGQWFGTADAGEAALHSGRYLFLPAAGGTEGRYWTQSYDTATGNPAAFLISSGTGPATGDMNYTTACVVRCIKQ